MQANPTQLPTPLVKVTCPACGAENIGSALLCAHCRASLAGLQREFSGDPPPVKPAFETFPYEFFVPADINKTMHVPLGRCSSCFADLKALPQASAAAIAAAANLPPAEPAKSYPGADLEVRSSFTEIAGRTRVTTTKSIKFKFPLCEKCFYDHLVLKEYQPGFYDPTFKERRPSLPLAIFFCLVAAVQLVTGITHTMHDPNFGFLDLFWVLGSLVWVVFGVGLGSMTKYYDRKLRAGLAYDAGMRYGEIKPANAELVKRPSLDPNFLNSLYTSRRYYHYKLLFRNEQYRDLFASANQVDAPSTDPVKLEREKIKAAAGPLVQDERVQAFYRRSLAAWKNGELEVLNRNFKIETAPMQLEDYIKKYPPYQGGALAAFFEQFPLLEGEFLIGVGDLKTEKVPGWFVLTNLRLIQRDGQDNRYREIDLADIASYEQKGGWTGTLVIRLKSGGEITFKKVLRQINEEFLNWAIAHCQ